MGTSAGPRKQSWIPLWLGIAAVWSGVLVLVWLLAPESLTTASVVATVVAIVAGVVRTRRVLARGRQRLITTKDLRRR